MTLNRRNFLKYGSIAGAGILGSKILPSCKPGVEEYTESNLANIKEQALLKRPQKFNMCGLPLPGWMSSVPHISALGEVRVMFHM